MKTPTLSLPELQAARERLAGSIRCTPSHIAPSISALTGMRVWLKRDDLQRTGSFKERGARHALLRLSDEERSRGVVAASAGNHALGLAFHGASLGIAVRVVMPRYAPDVKVARCRGLGAEVILHGDNFDASQTFALALARRTGATYVHPFDDLNVIAGQGTMALELLEQVPFFDTIVVPVGGGGLLAGVSSAIKAVRKSVRVIAVEPENAAGFLTACLAGRDQPAPLLPTLADGLAVSRVGVQTFAIAASLVDDVVTVSEFEIAAAMRVLARNEGIVAEGAGAAGVAAVLAGKVSGRELVLPIGGRNVDMHKHAAIIADEPALQSMSAAA
jgi:threonine dehydratase